MKSEESAIVFATPVYSLWQLSDALGQLRVSHSVYTQRKTQPPLVRNLRRPQPKWVHVTSDVRDIKSRSVNFITASYAELSLTNYPKLREDLGDLDSALRHALNNLVSIVPRVDTKQPMDYVNEVSKPSLLNSIQTQIYKIQPYSLRKETQALVLGYFASTISRNKVVRALERSFKTAGLIPLMDEGYGLRAAVARLKQEPLEVVAEQTDISTFDLLYLSKVRKAKNEERKQS
jgi:hypothetical protein